MSDKPFGDFDDDDAMEEFPELSDEEWEQVGELANEMDRIKAIQNPSERKARAKQLVSELNGER